RRARRGGGLRHDLLELGHDRGGPDRDHERPLCHPCRARLGPGAAPDRGMPAALWRPQSGQARMADGARKPPRPSPLCPRRRGARAVARLHPARGARVRRLGVLAWNLFTAARWRPRAGATMASQASRRTQDGKAGACILQPMVGRRSRRRARAGLAWAALGLMCGALSSGVSLATAATQPVELAAPYEYLGWGNPQPPAAVLASTGIKDLTLAFIISHGACNPTWDGTRPLLGGSDQAAIESIRAAGGDVVVSFGGWSGKKLGNSCKSVSA